MSSFPQALGFGTGLSAIRTAVKRLLGEHLSVTRYGAKAATVLADASMASGSDLLNSPSGFAADVVGMWFVVPGALGVLLDPFVSVCVARVSSTQVRLASPATAAVVAGRCVFGIDNQEAINTAYEDCLVKGKGSLLLPAGRFLYRGGLLAQSHVHLHGRGSSSILYSASFAEDGASALIVDAKTNLGVFNVGFECEAKERKENEVNARLLIRASTDVRFDAVHIDGSNTVGVFITNSQRIAGGTVHVANTMADGVHTTNGSKNVNVATIIGFNTGDDTAAMVSYAADPAGQVEDCVYGFVKSVNSGGRGFGIVGPKNCQVNGYQIEDPYAHGWVVSYEPAFATFTPSFIRIGPGRLKGVKTSPSFNGFFVGGFGANIPENIVVSQPILEDCNQAQVISARRVRIEHMEKTGGNYRGLLVKDSFEVDTIGSVFKDIDAEAITYDNVIGGRIDRCAAYECQVTANPSRGRFSVLESRNIIGRNYDFRNAITSASYGALLVSNTSGTDFLTNLVQVDGHAPAAAVGSRIFGMVYDSMRQLLRIENDFEPVNESVFGIITKKGVFIINGPLHLEGDHPIEGSGGAASIRLHSGFVRVVSPSSATIQINSDGVGSGETFDVYSASLRVLALTGDGDLYTRGGLRPSNTGSGIGVFAIDGASPEGLLAAPVGSICFRDWASLTAAGADAATYRKMGGGSGPTGWVPVDDSKELPSLTGNAKKVLRVNAAATNIEWSKVAIDDPAMIELPSIGASRYLYHSSSGGNQIVGKGPADVYIEVVQPRYDDIAAGVKPFLALEIDDVSGLQTALDGKADTTHGHSGTTSSDGTPAHTHNWST